MNKKESIELFKSFLIENDAYEQFIHNLHEDFNLTFQKVQPRYYLIKAFTFRITVEGFDYWIGMNSKWVSYYNNHRNG